MSTTSRSKLEMEKAESADILLCDKLVCGESVDVLLAGIRKDKIDGIVHEFDNESANFDLKEIMKKVDLSVHLSDLAVNSIGNKKEDSKIEVNQNDTTKSIFEKFTDKIKTFLENAE